MVKIAATVRPHREISNQIGLARDRVTPSGSRTLAHLHIHMPIMPEAEVDNLYDFEWMYVPEVMHTLLRIRLQETGLATTDAQVRALLTGLVTEALHTLGY